MPRLASTPNTLSGLSSSPDGQPSKFSKHAPCAAAALVPCTANETSCPGPLGRPSDAHNEDAASSNSESSLGGLRSNSNTSLSDQHVKAMVTAHRRQQALAKERARLLFEEEQREIDRQAKRDASLAAHKMKELERQETALVREIEILSSASETRSSAAASSRSRGRDAYTNRRQRPPGGTRPLADVDETCAARDLSDKFNEASSMAPPLSNSEGLTSGGTLSPP